MQYKKASHRKVRTGCLQCKGRRVKVGETEQLLGSLSRPSFSSVTDIEQCDETKPKCLNCIRYPSDCSFETVSERNSKAQHVIPQILPKPKPSIASSGNPEFSFWDFKLLNHWTVSTSESLADNKSLQLAMRDVLPRLAIDHSGLLWVSPVAGGRLD
jgi:hypothetical protein